MDNKMAQIRDIITNENYANYNSQSSQSLIRIVSCKVHKQWGFE